MTPRDTERSPLLATKSSSSSSSWRRALAAAAVVVGVVAIFSSSRPAHEFGVEHSALTIPQRLGAAMSASARKELIDAKISKLKALSARLEDESERKLAQGRFMASDVEAASETATKESVATCSVDPTQNALKTRYKSMMSREKGDVERRKNLDVRLKQKKKNKRRGRAKDEDENASAALGGLQWISNVVEKASEITSISSEIIGEFAEEVDEGSGFCWRESYTREGVLPQHCEDGQEVLADGFYCYDKCDKYDTSDKSYKRYGYDCHQNCNSGWTDTGLTCNNPSASYGRGVGTIECSWSWSTWSVNCGGSLCTAKGKEDYLGLCYDKCKSGYSNFGSNICVMDCAEQGYHGGIAPSCVKDIKISPGMTPSTCPPGTEYDGGLCYEPCKTNFTGVGFVCWGGAPNVNNKDWVLCGMGAAVDDATCALVITDQIMGPLEMVAFFATLGSSSGATTAAKVGVKTATKGAKAIDKAGDTFKAIKKTAEELENAVSTAEGVVDGVEDLVECETEADCIRVAAEVAALFDPTGIASTVAAYSHDICTRYTEDAEAIAEMDPELKSAQIAAVEKAFAKYRNGGGKGKCAKAAYNEMLERNRSQAEAEEIKIQVKYAIGNLTAAST